MDWGHTIALLMIAFACNLPLGKWRSMERKLSAKWFIAIHLSIPLLVFLRLYWQLSLWFIPFGIGVAALSQLLGGAVQAEWFCNFKRRDS